jgi:hypothetical protein
MRLSDREMELPYLQYLESNSEILSQWGTEGTFIHVLVDHIKKLLSKRKTSKYNSWRSAIPKIIPWVVFKHPDLLARQNDLSHSVFEIASEKCIDVAYCILGLLLDDETKRQIEGSCRRDSGAPCSMISTHPLVELMKAINPGKDWCPHRDTNGILKYHRELEAFLKKAVSLNNELSRTCLHHAIKEFRSHPNREAVARLVRLSGKEVIMAKSDTPPSRSSETSSRMTDWPWGN